MQPTYPRHRFPPEIISHAVWLYHRFTLSFRDVEDLLAERGVEVSYEAISCWCVKFGPQNLLRQLVEVLVAQIEAANPGYRLSQSHC